jgi:hypothetical protein
MRALCCVAIFGAALAARADESGIQFGVRAAYMHPVGDIDAETAFSDLITGFVPIGLEVGYSFGGYVYLGAYGEYGFGFTHNCDAVAPDCSAHSISAGADLRLRFLPRSAATPWIGVSAGYEWLVLSVSDGPSSATSVLRGLRFPAVSVGVDFIASRAVAVGPYASATLGRYTDSHLAGSRSSSPIDAAYHGFVQAGLRVTFLP